MDQVEFISCPNCEQSVASPWAHESGFTLMKCTGCGLLYVNPRPLLSTISEASVSGVHGTKDGRLVVTSHRKPKKVARNRRIFAEFFREEIAAGRSLRWMDIGAGYGEAVEAAASLMPLGSYICGIEPMQVKMQAARDHGLEITDTPLAEIKEKFDVISMINVFSHIPDFRGFLCEIRQRLHPGGVFFLETGNGADLNQPTDFPDRLDLPDHLVFTGRQQMKQMLEKSGFILERCAEKRVDSPLWVARVMARDLMSRRLSVHLPWTSPFRTLLCRARLVQ